MPRPNQLILLMYKPYKTTYKLHINYARAGFDMFEPCALMNNNGYNEVVLVFVAVLVAA